MAPSTYYNTVAIYELIKFLSFKRVGVIYGYRQGVTNMESLGSRDLHRHRIIDHHSHILGTLIPIMDGTRYRHCRPVRDITHAARDLFLGFVDQVSASR